LLSNTCGWREKFLQHQMHGQIENQSRREKNEREVQGSRAELPIPKWIAKGEVDIARRRSRPRGKQSEDGDDALQLEGAAVITGATEGPQKSERQRDVKKGDQAQPERILRIEHVFGTAENVTAEKNVPNDVECPESAGGKYGNRLAGDEQRIAGGEAETAKDHGNIAEKNEIGRAPEVPVNGRPEEQKEDCDDACGDGKSALV